jgi:FAD:protein FMN transferase
MVGGMLQVSVWEPDTMRALAAMDAARAAVERVDSLMSIDRPGSEIAAVNRRAGTDSATILSPWTAEVVDSALLIAAGSAGALDVTAGRAADASARAEGSVSPRAVGDSAAARGDWRMVRFDRLTRRASLPRRGMHLDVAGLARGFALDRARDALRAAGVTRAVVDLAGDFAMMGAAPMAERWSMALRNPFQLGEVFAAVQLDSGAVATLDQAPASAGDGPRVLDPRSGQPVRGIVSVSVIAPSGLLADALSHAFFVLGPAEGCRMAARYPGVDALWVRDAEAEDDDKDERDSDDGVDPHLVVITDALADRLELLSEEPAEALPTRCSALLAVPGAGVKPPGR